MESVTEVATEVTTDIVILLEKIETGVSIQTHLLYLLIAVLFAYGIYRIYVSVFKPFV